MALKMRSDRAGSRGLTSVAEVLRASGVYARSMGVDAVDPQVKALQIAQAYLVGLQDRVFAQVYTESAFAEARGTRDIRGKLRAYLRPVPELEAIDGLETHLYFILAGALARYGRFDRAGDALSGVGSYASFFEDHERGGELPDVIVRQLDAVIPGVVASAVQEFSQRPRPAVGDKARDFLDYLRERNQVLVNNAMVYAFRVHGEDSFYRNFDPARGQGFLASGAGDRILSRIMDGDASVPGGSEFYLLARALGASVRNFGSGPVAFSQGFARYPELKSPKDLEDGLASPRKKTLADGNFYFNPVFFFRRALAAAQDGGRSTLLGLYYGFDEKTMGLLQRLLVGDAALVDFSETTLREMFDEALDSNAAFDGGKGSPYEYLRSCIVTPDAGGRSDAQGYALTLSKVMGRKFEMGPKAVALVLVGLGAGDPAMSSRLLVHAQTLGDSKYARTSGHVRTLVSRSRGLLLGRMSFSPLLGHLVSTVVPLVRVPAPVGVKGEGAVEDATHKVLNALVQTADRLTADPASFEYQIRMQVLMGYYCLGAKAYEGLDLPYQRMEKCPSRNLVGLLPAMEGKRGAFREFYMGFRLPYSARMVATADTGLPADCVGIPAWTMATLRGHLLSRYLREEAEPEDLEGRMRARFLVAVFDAYSVDCPDCNMMSELRHRIGALREGLDPKSGEALDFVLRSFEKTFPESERGDFLFVCGDRARGAQSYSARSFLRRLAYGSLNDPMVSGYLGELNREWPFVVSRFPRLHAQSFIAVHGRLNAVDDESIRSHPIVANGLNLDYDGDMIECIGVRNLNPAFKALLDRFAVDTAVFDAGTASSLIFGLNLNALEGLVKGNMHFHPKGGDTGDALAGDVFRAAVESFLPGREELLRACQTDSNALVSTYSGLVQQVAKAFSVDPAVVSSRFVIGPEGTTTVARGLLHAVLERVLGVGVNPALGSFYLEDGRKSFTDTAKLQGLLLSRTSGVSFERPVLLAAFAGVYNLGSYLAVMQSGSGSVKGLPLAQQLAYADNDVVVRQISDAFRSRATTLELARARGFISDSVLKAGLLRLEHGSGHDDGWQAGFAALRQDYLGSSAGDRADTYDKARSFLETQLGRPDVGLKPLLKSALYLATDKYEFEHGAPHVWTEQILSGRIKAKDDILGQASMGAVQVVGDELRPTTLDGLLEGLTPDGLATAGMPAMWRSVETKSEVPVTGEFLKDLEALMRIVTVGEDQGGESLSLPLSKYLGSGRAGDMRLLVEQIKCRDVKLATGQENLAVKQPLEERLRALLFRMPFDARAVEGVLRELHALDELAELEVRTPLYDRGFPLSVSARSIGANPMEGLRMRDGAAERIPLVEMPHLQMPIGSVTCGAIGEDSNQAAMRTRHVSGSVQEVYADYADYWKMKYGPFPSRSPYFRKGAERLVSENPMKYAGLQTFRTVFSAKVPGVKDEALRMVHARMVVGGVELFPGESYLVKDGRLVAGTDQPHKMCFSLPPNMDGIPGVERVVPSRVLITVTADAYARVIGDGSGLKDAKVDSCFITGYRTGEFCQMAFDSGDFEKMARVVGCLGVVDVAPAEGARFVAAIPSVTSPSITFNRVVDAAAFHRAGEHYVPDGALYRDGDMFAIISTERQMREASHGFGVFLDHLKGRELTPYSAKLAPFDCRVGNIEPLGTQGGVSAYKIVLKEEMPVDESVQAGLARIEKLQESVEALVNMPWVDGSGKKRPVGESSNPGDLRDYNRELYAHQIGCLNMQIADESNYIECRERDFEGRCEELHIELPAGHFPAVRAGQCLGAGDPMTFGHVKLEDRARLRPQFREELSQYLYSYYYEPGKSSMWSAHLELLARSLVFPSKDGDRFVPLGKAYQKIGAPEVEHGDVRLSRTDDAAARLGNLDALLQSMFLNVGFVSSLTNAPLFSPKDLERGDARVYPLHDARKYSDFTPLDLTVSGKRVVAEMADAIGMGL